jgi:hypothetical protein
MVGGLAARGRVARIADLAWHGPLFQNYLAIQAAEAGQGFALADQLNATDALAAGTAGEAVRLHPAGSRKDTGWSGARA